MVITVFERMYRYKESDAANHKLQLTSTKSLLYYKDHSGLGYSTTKTTVVLAWLNKTDKHIDVHCTIVLLRKRWAVLLT